MSADRPGPAAVERRSVSPLTLVLHALRGMAMGIAEALPGISGGTVALIVSIYERLVASIHAAARVAVNLLRGRPRRAGAAIRDIHFDLMVPLLAAMVPTALVGFVVFGDLLDRYEAPFRAVLFGLVLASLRLPWRQISARSARHWSVAATGALAAFVLTGLPVRDASTPALWLVALAAAVALTAWILPGVSGSYLLLVLGVYPFMGPAIRTGDVTFIAAFAVGGVIGLGGFSSLLAYLLRRHHDMTMALLAGLLLGALRTLWPWQTEQGALLPPDSASLALLVALFVAGFAVVAALTAVADRARRRRMASQPRDQR